MKQYVGCRYSPGYAACPELSQNRDILIYLILKNGIELSETFQMHPKTNYLCNCCSQQRGKLL